jgi:O-antigen ligase
MVVNHVSVGTLPELGAAHNVYLQWLEQAGLLGTFPMFVCASLMVSQIAAGAIRRRHNSYRNLAILGVFLLILAQGATDFALEVPVMATFVSLLLGIAYGNSAPIAAAPRRSQLAARGLDR